MHTISVLHSTDGIDRKQADQILLEMITDQCNLSNTHPPFQLGAVITHTRRLDKDRIT